MKKTLNWNDILATCTRYNIPLNAEIQLATGWECSEVDANELYYNVSDNILYIVSEGCEYWFEKADILHLEVIEGDNSYLYEF